MKRFFPVCVVFFSSVTAQALELTEAANPNAFATESLADLHAYRERPLADRRLTVTANAGEAGETAAPWRAARRGGHIAASLRECDKLRAAGHHRERFPSRTTAPCAMVRAQDSHSGSS